MQAGALLVVLIGVGSLGQAAAPQSSSSSPSARQTQAAQGAAASASSGPDAALVLRRYCVSCHNDRMKTGGLALDTLNPAQVAGHEQTWEKVVRKLRAGSMPAAGRPRPTPAEYEQVATSLEKSLDAAATANPNPGRVADHRLNRTEYGNVIRDLLGLEINPAQFLPADDAEMGFEALREPPPRGESGSFVTQTIEMTLKKWNLRDF